MSGQQMIIERIKQEAEQNSERIVAEARQKAEAVLAHAQEQSRKLCEWRVERARQEAEEIVLGKQRHCEMEKRRRRMRARAESIEAAFSNARIKLESLGEKEYLEYVRGQIGRYAREGDEVIICKRDKKLITKEFVQGISSELGIELKLSKDTGEFTGGVILRGEYFDTNLTIDTSFRFFKDEMEARVSSMLEEGNV